MSVLKRLNDKRKLYVSYFHQLSLHHNVGQLGHISCSVCNSLLNKSEQVLMKSTSKYYISLSWCEVQFPDSIILRTE